MAERVGCERGKGRVRTRRGKGERKGGGGPSAPFLGAVAALSDLGVHDDDRLLAERHAVVRSEVLAHLALHSGMLPVVAMSESARLGDEQLLVRRLLLRLEDAPRVGRRAEPAAAAAVHGVGRDARRRDGEPDLLEAHLELEPEPDGAVERPGGACPTRCNVERAGRRHDGPVGRTGRRRVRRRRGRPAHALVGAGVRLLLLERALRRLRRRDVAREARQARARHGRRRRRGGSDRRAAHLLVRAARRRRAVDARGAVDRHGVRVGVPPAVRVVERVRSGCRPGHGGRVLLERVHGRRAPARDRRRRVDGAAVGVGRRGREGRVVRRAVRAHAARGCGRAARRRAVDRDRQVRVRPAGREGEGGRGWIGVSRRAGAQVGRERGGPSRGGRRRVERGRRGERVDGLLDRLPAMHDAVDECRRRRAGRAPTRARRPSHARRTGRRAELLLQCRLRRAPPRCRRRVRCVRNGRARLHRCLPTHVALDLLRRVEARFLLRRRPRVVPRHAHGRDDDGREVRLRDELGARVGVRAHEARAQGTSARRCRRRRDLLARRGEADERRGDGRVGRRGREGGADEDGVLHRSLRDRLRDRARRGGGARRRCRRRLVGRVRRCRVRAHRVGVVVRVGRLVECAVRRRVVLPVRERGSRPLLLVPPVLPRHARERRRARRDLAGSEVRRAVHRRDGGARGGGGCERVARVEEGWVRRRGVVPVRLLRASDDISSGRAQAGQEQERAGRTEVNENRSLMPLVG